MKEFDYSFLSNGLFPASFINLISDIASLNTLTALRKQQHIQAFNEFEALTRVQSVKEYTNLTDTVISDARIDAIVNKSSKPQNQDEIKIAQYGNMLNQINLEHEQIDFSENDIEHLQSMMSDGHDSFDFAVGNALAFQPLTEVEALQAMHQLEAAYNKAKNNPNINKLLLVPCVIFDYICIYPFHKSSDNMIRLLSQLLLNKFGYDAGRYVSTEDQIIKCRADYHDAFVKSSIDWDSNQNNYFPFIECFLNNLRMCYRELDHRFEVIGNHKLTKKARIEALVLSSLKPLSKADICRYLPHISPTTVEAALGSMVKNGIIKRLGSARTSKYIKAEKLSDNKGIGKKQQAAKA